MAGRTGKRKKLITEIAQQSLCLSDMYDKLPVFLLWVTDVKCGEKIYLKH
ncbi:hypothetical protein CF161_23626 [Pseudomonas sp. CF161]|nr:hypothetical protein CF161_23626 [Pseudomonas sp. CF161]